MATIADMMPKTEDNEIIIAEGVEFLKSSWRPAIQVLFGLKNFRSLDTLQRVYRVNSLLNARDMENNFPASYRMLMSKTKEEAKILAEKLFEKDVQRRERIKEIKDSLESKVGEENNSPLIFEGDSSWEVSFLGIVASIEIHKYKKPVFLFKKGDEESQGGIRAPDNFNVVEAMKSCADLLLTYGGHPQAGGFRIKNENLEKFKAHLQKYFK
jgi:single-stranded-DNA-specific exonuclease